MKLQPNLKKLNDTMLYIDLKYFRQEKIHLKIWNSSEKFVKKAFIGLTLPFECGRVTSVSSKVSELPFSVGDFERFLVEED